MSLIALQPKISHANQESSSSLIQILKHTADVYSSGRFSVPINCEMLIYMLEMQKESCSLY